MTRPEELPENRLMRPGDWLRSCADKIAVVP